MTSPSGTSLSGKSLSGKVALVTGASRGIGRALAIELGRRGAQCVLIARTQGGLEETDDAIRAAGGLEATLLPFDLVRQADKIEMIGPSIVQRFGRLDILVHNAGALGTLTPVSHVTPKDWADVVGVNLTASLHLIRTAEPPLRASPAGRAVFITSGRVQRPKPYWGAYGATKAGMEHLVQTWAAELSNSAVRANLFDPDVVATRMRATAMPGEDPDTLRQPADIAPALADLCEASEARNGETIRLAPLA